MITERMAVDAATRTISGYVALFDVPTMFMGKTEMIPKGAFDETMRMIDAGKHIECMPCTITGASTPKCWLTRATARSRSSWTSAACTPLSRLWADPVGDMVINRVDEGFADGASFGFHQQSSHGA